MQKITILFALLISANAFAAHPWAEYAGCYTVSAWNGRALGETHILSRVLDQSYSTFYYDPSKVDIPSLDFLIYNPGDRTTHFSSAFASRGTYTRDQAGLHFVSEDEVVSGFVYEVVNLKQELSILPKADGVIEYSTHIVTTRKDGTVNDDRNSYELRRVDCAK